MYPNDLEKSVERSSAIFRPGSIAAFARSGDRDIVVVAEVFHILFVSLCLQPLIP